MCDHREKRSYVHIRTLPTLRPDRAHVAKFCLNTWYGHGRSGHSCSDAPVVGAQCDLFEKVAHSINRYALCGLLHMLV